MVYKWVKYISSYKCINVYEYENENEWRNWCMYILPGDNVGSVVAVVSEYFAGSIVT